jgi:hypothetical protein
MASIFKKIGKAIKKGVHDVGGFAEKAAPYVGMIPGVGTIAGGAIGGLGALAHGDGLSGALKYGAMGAASGFGGSKLLGLAKGAAGSLTAPGAAGTAGGDAGGSAIQNLVASAAKRGLSISDLLKMGASGVSAIAGIKSANRSGRAEAGAMSAQSGIADDLAANGRAMNARAAPLADYASKALMTRLQAGPRTQLIDQVNPFAKHFAPPPAAPSVTAPPPRLALPAPAPAPQLAPPPGAAPAGLRNFPLMKRLVPAVAQ